VDGQIREDRGLEQRASSVLRSQVACAVLALVIERPSYGYEIARRMEERFDGILSAGRSKSSVYSALTALSEAGLTEKLPPGRARTGARQGAKAGPSYRATALGARTYRAWLAERVQQDPDRLDMLGRMALVGVNSAEAALEFIEHYEQQSVSQAKALIAPPDGGTDTEGFPELMGRLMMEEQRRMLDAKLGWSALARAEIRGFIARRQ
jgi:DNA-binding PadR family transcriptional regulator